MTFDTLWSQVLSEVASSRAQQARQLLVLGDRGAGKSTLIKRWKNAADTAAPTVDDVALSYTYTEVKDEDDGESLGRIGIWQLEGDAAFGDLLRWALAAPGALAQTAVVIVLDWSKPWALESSLLQWIDLLQHTLTALTASQVLSKDAVQAAQEAVAQYIVAYQNKLSGIGSTDATSVAEANSATVLEHNLALPLAIVVAKSDVVDSLHKTNNIGEPHLDYIQQVLRRIALKYGAALAFLSTAQNKNVDTTLKYLVHRLFGTSIDRAGSHRIASRDALFIPAGWDTLAKIDLVTVDSGSKKAGGSSAKAIPVDMPFAEVISPPESTQVTKKAALLAESEDEFLVRLKNMDESTLASIVASSAQDQGKTLAGAAGALGTSAGSLAAGKSPRPRSTKPEGGRPAGATDAAAAPKAETEQYQNFFQSLLKKGTTPAAQRNPSPKPGSGDAASAPAAASSD